MTGDDLLSLVQTTIIAGFTVEYSFDVGEFLDRYFRDRDITAQRVFLAYPYMITQLCLVTEVLKLPGVDEMIES